MGANHHTHTHTYWYILKKHNNKVVISMCLRVTAPTRCDRHDRWFQRFVFNFCPDPWGNDPNWLAHAFQVGGLIITTTKCSNFHQKSNQSKPQDFSVALAVQPTSLCRGSFKGLPKNAYGKRSCVWAWCQCASKVYVVNKSLLIWDRNMHKYIKREVDRYVNSSCIIYNIHLQK